MDGASSSSKSLTEDDESPDHKMNTHRTLSSQIKELASQEDASSSKDSDESSKESYASDSDSDNSVVLQLASKIKAQETDIDELRKELAKLKQQLKDEVY